MTATSLIVMFETLAKDAWFWPREPMLIPWVWYPIVAFSKRTLCEPDCTAIESSQLNITLLVILMFGPVTSKPSVLKGNFAVVEYASMIASLTVMLLPIN